MLQIGKYKFEGKRETLLYVVCGVSALYTVVNGLLPDILDVERFFNLPIFIEAPLYVIGTFGLTAVAAVVTLFVVATLDERNQALPAIKKLDLFRLITRDSRLLAPNLDKEEREAVIAALRSQSSSGEITKAFALLEEGEEGCQQVLLLTNAPQKIRDAWIELSEGARILSPKKMRKKYGIESELSAVEVIWD